MAELSGNMTEGSIPHLPNEGDSLYKQLIEAAEDRIAMFTPDGEAIIVNSAFTSVLGYTPEEYFNLSEMDLVHPEDREKMKALQKEFLEKGGVEAEYRIRHKDGRDLHMSSKSVLLRGDGLRKDYVLFIMRDITEKKKAEEELLQAKEKAEESDMLKSAFLANMSHEIRTPMNSIVGFSNLLTQSGLDEETRKVYVERINRNSEQLLTLISDIIDLSKIESNQLTIFPVRVILDHLFSDLVSFARELLSRRGNDHVEIRYEPDPEHPDQVIFCDRMRLLQVFQNLVNNAVKFTPEGTITLGYNRINEHMVRMFVRDTGIGIDKTNHRLIFEHFRQIDGSNTRKFGGTGLGLSISKQLTELMGGKIWVESETDSGSVFFVEIPGDDATVSREKIARGEATSGHQNKEYSVMIADDDPDSIDLLTTLLDQEGHEVIPFRSAYTLLQKLECSQVPDLLMLDLQMPVLNGYHTLRIIKDLYPELKIIAQSAHALEGERKKCLAMGFDGYLSKPYSASQIRQEIFTVLKK